MQCAEALLAEALLAIVTAPRSLAINGIDGLLDFGRLSGLLLERQEPGGESSLKGGGMKQRQHPPEHILSRYAVGEVEYAEQEGFFRLRPLRNRRRAVRAGQNVHQRDDRHADKRMLLMDRAK